MKILMLTPYLPYPLLSGGQIRTYNLLKKLKDKYEITLFSFIRSSEEKKHLSELSKFCKNIQVFKRRPAWNWRNVVIAGFSPLPFVMVATYLSLKFKKAIGQELASTNYNLIHAEPFYMAPNIPKTDIPILLVEQTIEYLVYKKYADDFKIPVLKPFLYTDVYKLKFWEEYYWRQATSLVAMSKEDKEIMAKAAKGKTIDIVANGVDIDFFKQTKIQRPKRPTVLFVGNFKWLPNKDAALYLTNEIWPIIKARLPQAKLWIVGKNPTPEIVNLGNKKDVVVDSTIEDIRTAFGQSSVMLAPIRNGRGTKYKVLEAMASHLPVVTTHLGIEGMEAVEGKDVLLAESKDELAKLTIDLLTDKGQSERLSDSAYHLVKNKYHWDIISKSLDKVYQKIARKKG